MGENVCRWVKMGVDGWKWE